MFARELVSDVIKPLRTEMTGEQAILLMHDYMVTQMPLVDADKFIGLLTMEEIFAMPEMAAQLGAYFTNPKRVYVNEGAHVLEVMRAAISYSVKVVPVLGEDEKFIGVVSAETCLRAFADMNAVMAEGAILELEIATPDYQLSEVARIVEDNHGQVLSAYANNNSGTGKTTITLKLNLTDLSHLVAAFERYEYTVLSVFNETNYTEDVKDRYDALMRFLNV
ncbi:MAG: CBS domain-containing protein [Chitinophagales bacterium]